MLISNWMTHDPIAVSPTTSLSKCQKLMKTNSFHRLPVIDENRKVVGIISDRDVKSASPSKATSLEIHEVQYLLAEVKAKDIMTPKPVTVKSTDTVATAALLMLDKKIGGLPVVDDDGVLIGIITDQDIFKVFVTISGARIDGIDVTVEAPNTPGSLGPIFEALRENNARIISVMTSYLDNGLRHIYFRLRTPERVQEEHTLHDALAGRAKVIEWSVTRGAKD